jgi:predicted enzyme related to lactoylglutathione lyase
MDWKIELIPMNVSDVDAAVEFYGKKVGWNVDHDQSPTEGLRFVQVTPPGSACSFCFGTGLDMLDTTTKQHVQIVVADADEAHRYLTDRDIECTDVEELPWGRFVHFDDLDGNKWSMQQLVPR